MTFVENRLHKILRRAGSFRLFTLAFVLAMTLSMSVTASAAGGLEMSTDYPGLTVKAGDELDFSLDF